MSQAEIWSTASAVLVSLGGGGFIVWALSSYLGNIWAKKLLTKYQADLDKELEKIKKEYTAEIELYKVELEKAKDDYRRFSTKKFEIVEATWSAMFDVVDELKLYNPNDGDYRAHLLNRLSVVIQYLKLIKKNSLYFENETKELLDKYVFSASKVASDISKKVKESKNLEQDFDAISNEAQTLGEERERLLNEVRNKFRGELGFKI